MRCLIALVIGLAAPWALAQSPLHGRVSYDAGSTMVKGVDDAAWSHATVNTLVLPGDTLWVDDGGTSEVEFSGGAFLRLADGSKAEVAGLSGGVQLRAWEGAFYAQRLARASGDFTIETPACVVAVERDAAVRIDVMREGATTVSVRWGRAEVRGKPSGSASVAQGERVWVDPGLLPSSPSPFDLSREDAFDAWHRDRAKLLVAGPDPVPVPVDDTVIGVSELRNYGEWVYVDSQPYWRPTVVVDYVPYRYGYWSSVPAVGNVWVGYYPFCYTTSHYGYWSYNNRYGWIWGYRPAWSPAWCATLRYGDHYFWSPVDAFYRPVLVGTSLFSVGGVNFSLTATSYVPVSSVYYGWTSVSPIGWGFVNDIYRAPYQVNIWNINVNTSPHVRPPYNHDFPTTRNYNPPRAIRGPDAFPGRSALASNRVADLETRLGRTQFAAAQRSGDAGGATRSSAPQDGTRLRNVRMSEETPGFSRATRSAPVSATQQREAVVRRAEESGMARLVNTDIRSDSRAMRETAPSGEGAARGTQRSLRESGDPAGSTVVRRTTPGPDTPGYESRGGRVMRSAPPAAAGTPDREARTVAPREAAAPQRAERSARVSETGGEAPQRAAGAPERTPSRETAAYPTGDRESVRLNGTPVYSRSGDGPSYRSFPGSTARNRGSEAAPAPEAAPEPRRSTVRTAPAPQSFDAPEPRIERRAVEAPRAEPRRVEAPRYEAPAPEPRSAPAPRMRAPEPRYDAPAPRMEAPRAASPRVEAPRAASPRMDFAPRGNEGGGFSGGRGNTGEVQAAPGARAMRGRN